MSDRTFLLQDWVTVRSTNGTLSALVQSQEGWLDLTGFADASFWIDVTEVTPPGGVSSNYLQLLLETAPTCDDIPNPSPIAQSWFQPTTGPILLGAGTGVPFLQASPTPFVRNSVRSSSTVSLSRYLRWRIAPSTSGAWDLTFRIRVVANRSGFFVPTDLPGCVLWLRADLGASLGTTNKVSQWNDSSAAGDSNHNVTQGNTSFQPALTAADVNYGGQPTLQFVRANGNYMTSGLWASALSQPNTWVAVGYAVSTSLGEAFLDGNDVNTGQNLGRDGANDVYTNAGKVFTWSNAWNTAGSVVLAEYNGASSHIFYNDFTTPKATGDVGTRSQGSMSIASSNVAAGGPGAYWDGSIAEIIGFNGILSNSAKARLRAYLNARYGLSIT